MKIAIQFSNPFVLIFLIGTAVSLLINHFLEFVDYKARCKKGGSLPEEIKNLTKLQVLHIDNWQPPSERFSDEYKQHLQDLLPNCRIHFDKNDY